MKNMEIDPEIKQIAKDVEQWASDKLNEKGWLLASDVYDEFAKRIAERDFKICNERLRPNDEG